MTVFNQGERNKYRHNLNPSGGLYVLQGSVANAQDSTTMIYPCEIAFKLQRPSCAYSSSNATKEECCAKPVFGGSRLILQRDEMLDLRGWI